MATSADRDDRDDRDDDEKDEKDEAEDKPAKKQGEKASPKTGSPVGAPSTKASASRPAAKEADEDEEDEDEDEEEDEKDEDEDEEDEEEAEEKPAPKSAGKSAGKASSKAASKRPAKDEEEDEDEEPAPRRPAARGPGAKGPGAKARGPGAGRARPAAAAQGGSLGKSVALFFVIVIGLGAGFAILGRETPQEVAKPKWKVGDINEVEITLVRSDRGDLACASTDEVAGKHCAFEAQNKPWSKGGDPSDDKNVLKPYTTMDRMQFVAAGLWNDPGMSPDKLPATRFSVKCKYKVEGSLKNLGVRWEQTGQWYQQSDWYAGSIADCKLVP